MNALKKWLFSGSPEANAAAPKNGSDPKECALDGLYHEVENPNWRRYDESVERMIIHIYDAPPHGTWRPSGSDPEQHC